MKELNKVNRGFELMLPREPVLEEETVKNYALKEFRLIIFGFELYIGFSLSRYLEKEK